VHRELRENGIRTSRKRVERLMREDGLCARPRRRRPGTTDSAHQHPVTTLMRLRGREPATLQEKTQRRIRTFLNASEWVPKC
jgi:transposase InsO family protein